LKYSSLILLITLFFTAACSSAITEQEPNNSISSAQIIKPGDVIEGKILNQADRDCFFVHVPGRKWMNKVINLKLTHSVLADIKINIYKNGKLIKQVDDFAVRGSRYGRKTIPQGNETVEQFANLALFPGRYVFMLRLASRSRQKLPVSYVFTTKMESRSDVSEIEPNDFALYSVDNMPPQPNSIDIKESKTLIPELSASINSNTLLNPIKIGYFKIASSSIRFLSIK